MVPAQAAPLTLCLCGDLGELRGRGITNLGVVAGHVCEQAPHVGFPALVVAHAPHNDEGDQALLLLPMSKSGLR